MPHRDRKQASSGTTRRPSPARAANLLALVASTTLFLLGIAAASSAHAAPAIERVWSFNGGEVAVQAEADGSFQGTVIAPTQFARCTHPVGETMWRGMLAQPDGSYWGFHRWFYETIPCMPEEQPGPTAWRVMKGTGSDNYLLVCFGSPGGLQPTIAPTGSTANVGYGCVRSAEVAPLGSAEAFASAVTLPSAKRCLSRRSFQIHLHQSRYDPFREVLVLLGQRRLLVTRHGNVFAARINLRGLPRGAFDVRVRVTTVLGHVIAGRRTFHTCVSRVPPRHHAGRSTKLPGTG